MGKKMEQRYSFTSIMRVIFSLCITSLMLPKAYAKSPISPMESGLSTIEDYLKLDGQDLLLAESFTEIPTAPTLIGWNATWDKLLITGAIEHNFSGHRLFIRLGFTRGSFDPYTQTYRSVPGIILYDSTEDSVYPYLLAGTGKNYQGGTLNIWVEFNGTLFEIKNNNNPSEHGKYPYSDLLAIVQIILGSATALSHSGFGMDIMISMVL
jgi:hypothetical protein